MSKNGRLLSVSQAMKYLGIGRKSLIAEIHAGTISAISFPNTKRVKLDRQVLDRWLSENANLAPVRLTQESMWDDYLNRSRAVEKTVLGRDVRAIYGPNTTEAFNAAIQEFDTTLAALLQRLPEERRAHIEKALRNFLEVGEQYDQKRSVDLGLSHTAKLDGVVERLLNNGKKRKGRLKSSAVIRALVDAADLQNLDVSNVHNEQELKKAVIEHLRKPTNEEKNQKKEEVVLDKEIGEKFAVREKDFEGTDIGIFRTF